MYALRMKVAGKHVGRLCIRDKCTFSLALTAQALSNSKFLKTVGSFVPKFKIQWDAPPITVVIGKLETLIFCTVSE